MCNAFLPLEQTCTDKLAVQSEHWIPSVRSANCNRCQFDAASGRSQSQGECCVRTASQEASIHRPFKRVLPDVASQVHSVIYGNFCTIELCTSYDIGDVFLTILYS